MCAGRLRPHALLRFRRHWLPEMLSKAFARARTHASGGGQLTLRGRGREVRLVLFGLVSRLCGTGQSFAAGNFSPHHTNAERRRGSRRRGRVSWAKRGVSPRTRRGHSPSQGSRARRGTYPGNGAYVGCARRGPTGSHFATVRALRLITCSFRESYSDVARIR